MVLAFFILIMMLSCKSTFLNNKLDEKIVSSELNYIPYYQKVNIADSLFYHKNYNDCFNLLDSLFKKYEPLNSINIYEYNDYVIASFKTNHYNGLKDKVTKLYTDFGGFMGNSIVNDSILKIVKLTSKDVLGLNQKYRSGLNDSLRTQILKMAKDDQRVRVEEYSVEGMEYYAKLHETDLDEIFKKYGYPSEKLIGSISFFGFDSKEEVANPLGILIHQGGNENAKTKIIPILFDFVKKGKCSPFIYANVYDKYEMIHNNKQYYNSFETAGVPMDTSVINRKRNDSIRKTIGLPSIGYNHWKYHIFSGQ